MSLVFVHDPVDVSGKTRHVHTNKQPISTIILVLCVKIDVGFSPEIGATFLNRFRVPGDKPRT